MYYTYVLFSSSTGKIYIGFSSNIEARLKSHNDPANRGWTKKYQPWIIVHLEEFENKSKAMLREKELKTARGRKFIRENIIANLS